MQQILLMWIKLDGLAMSIQTVPAAEPAMLTGLYSTLRVLQLPEGLHIVVGFTLRILLVSVLAGNE